LIGARSWAAVKLTGLRDPGADWLPETTVTLGFEPGWVYVVCSDLALRPPAWRCIYVGLDVYKNLCYATFVDERGEVVDRLKFPNTREGVSRFVSGLISDDSVMMEATSHWQYICDSLGMLGLLFVYRAR